MPRHNAPAPWAAGLSAQTLSKDGSSASTSGVATYSARRVATVGEFLRLADGLGAQAAMTPFQQAHWLVPWYATIGSFGTAEPLLIEVVDEQSGAIAMLLPLVVVSGLLGTSIEFADRCLTDYCVPLLGPAAPRTADAASAAWHSARACMPAADFIRIPKLPTDIGRRVNPLALLSVRPSAMVRNAVDLPDTWEAYLAARSAHFRKLLRQKMKALAQNGPVEFAVVEDCGEARRALQFLSALQRDRLEDIGRGFVLDQPPFCTFYDRLASESAPRGLVVISILRVGGEIVAAALTLRQDETATMIRLANAGGAWSRCSPGILLASETIRWLLESGIRTFDFGVGQYDYKQRFGCALAPLHVYEEALTARGRLALSLLRGRQRLEANAGLRMLRGQGRRVLRGLRRRRSARPAWQHEGVS